MSVVTQTSIENDFFCSLNHIVIARLCYANLVPFAIKAFGSETPPEVRL